ncbi:ECF RNA polymerase sigma factor SigE [Tepidimonas aquatica]|uniref:RNA polymerase sigma factor n=1 Tax=Tepidimonas aquatica TaxID=247482 RepID=A0A554WAX1_9BURK|nr:ECF RNA polymerase sigma factor SigE [Tepidimonas aquatica]
MAAQDLVQEVFVHALQAGRDFCELQQPRAWLFQVARSALVDWARRQRPSEPLPADDDLLPAVPAEADDDASPVDALADCLEAVLATLPAADADIVRRCDLEGMTQAAYAAQHGLSVPGAKSRLQRARRRLAEALTHQCGVRFEQQRVCCVVPSSAPQPGDG